MTLLSPARCASYATEMALEVLVLGSAAGGGFPQWNCGCKNCVRVRAGEPGWQARTQDSLAVSADGQRWWLLNASPDVLHQLQHHRELWPQRLRHSPVAGVVLTNGDLDHVLGLLQLRESQPLSVYATARVLEGLRQNAALRTLDRFEGHVVWRSFELNEPIVLAEPEGEPSGLSLLPFALPGKPPLHLAAMAPSPQDNVGLRLWTSAAPSGGALVYASAVASLAEVPSELDQCAALFVDGTFWSEQELPGQGIGNAPARAMAHLPIGGEAGSLRALARLNVGRRIYTHINNTNPILDPASPERAAVEGAGWLIAYDGLRISI
jgi:pyrroloquinoline quinone biosynthesis protein B